MLRHVEEGNHVEDLRMDVLQAIRFIIQAWDEVNVDTIRNCWCHTKILPTHINADTNMRNVLEDENLVLNDLADAFQALNFSHQMQLEEFLNISEEDVVYEIPEDDRIIEELVYLFKNADEENLDSEEMDDSREIPVISTNTAVASLETVHMYLLQQDNAEEYVKLVGKIEKFFKAKKTSSMRQTNINTYFFKST
jgi:hypothetical protein